MKLSSLMYLPKARIPLPPPPRAKSRSDLLNMFDLPMRQLATRAQLIARYIFACTQFKKWSSRREPNVAAVPLDFGSLAVGRWWTRPVRPPAREFVWSLVTELRVAKGLVRRMFESMIQITSDLALS